MAAIVGVISIHSVSKLSMVALNSRIVYDDLEKMEATYQLLRAVLQANNRGNGSRDVIEIEGADSRQTFVCADIATVNIQDYVKAEKAAADTEGVYPNLFKKKQDDE